MKEIGAFHAGLYQPVDAVRYVPLHRKACSISETESAAIASTIAASAHARAVFSDPQICMGHAEEQGNAALDLELGFGELGGSGGRSDFHVKEEISTG